MKLERLKDNKRIVYTVIIGLLLILTVTLFISRSAYRVTSTIPIAEDITTSESPNVIAVYLEDTNGTEVKNNIKYNMTDRIPSSDYVINEENSFCYIGTKNNVDSNARLYTNESGEHVISNLTKGNKCILYFNNKIENCNGACKTIVADKEILERKSENKDFNVPLVDDTTGKIYKAQDDDGTSYYFAGNPTDNWVEFGGYYWRIIRINGDGTIRMIYQGKVSDGPQTIGEETKVGTSAFNNLEGNNAYIGYWYQIGVLRGLQTPSTAYTYLNNWFASSNIKQGTSYFDLIDKDAGFCGDRTPSTSGTTIDEKGGTGTIDTYYGTSVRVAPNMQVVTSSTQPITPTLNCANSNDLYTYTNANHGNHKLANPVGLITADEASYAGLVFNTDSSNNYLDTDYNYWTMSPLRYNSGNNVQGTIVFDVVSTGRLGGPRVISNIGIRPVINLKADIALIGRGTTSDPFKIAS